MPMTEMIRRLEEEGVASERKSIYRDLAAMNKQGFEVAYRHGKTGGWYLAGRPLNLSELQTVIDAVAALPLDSSGAAGVSAGQAGRALSPGTARPAALPGLAAAPGGDSARGGPAGAGPRPHRPCKASGHCVLSRLCTTRRGDGFSRSTLWWWSAPRGCCGLRRGITCWGGTIEANRWPSIARIGCLRCWSRECPRRGPIPTRHCGPQPLRHRAQPAGAGAASLLPRFGG